MWPSCCFLCMLATSVFYKVFIYRGLYFCYVAILSNLKQDGHV